jgi:hypothetical protein
MRHACLFLTLILHAMGQCVHEYHGNGKWTSTQCTINVKPPQDPFADFPNADQARVLTQKAHQAKLDAQMAQCESLADRVAEDMRTHVKWAIDHDQYHVASFVSSEECPESLLDEFKRRLEAPFQQRGYTVNVGAHNFDDGSTTVHFDIRWEPAEEHAPQ